MQRWWVTIIIVIKHCNENDLVYKYNGIMVVNIVIFKVKENKFPFTQILNDGLDIYIAQVLAV